MKNSKKYTTQYKRVHGAYIRVRHEVKRRTLYCYKCHCYRPLAEFPGESGYGMVENSMGTVRTEYVEGKKVETAGKRPYCFRHTKRKEL